MAGAFIMGFGVDGGGSEAIGNTVWLRRRRSGPLGQFFQQRLGVDQVLCIKPLGEPAVDPGQQLSCF